MQIEKKSSTAVSRLSEEIGIDVELDNSSRWNTNRKLIEETAFPSRTKLSLKYDGELESTAFASHHGQKFNPNQLKLRQRLVETSVICMDEDNASDSHSLKRMEEMEEIGRRNEDTDQKISSSIGALSPELRDYDYDILLEADSGETQKTVGKLKESAIDLPSNHQSDDKQNIVNLIPSKSSRTSSLDELRTSLELNLREANWTSSPHCSPYEVAHTLHSCPLPFGIEAYREPQSISVPSSQVMELSSEALQKSAYTSRTVVLQSASNVEKNNSDTLYRNHRTLKLLNQGTAEQVIKKGRYSMPNRRFSFILGRMTKNFSFNGGLPFQELSPTCPSIKSGPLITKTSTISDSESEKACSHGRGRSSPLRRMLNPLLKPKNLSAEFSAEGSFKSFSFTPGQLADVHNRGTSSTRACMHLVVANGLPWFKFVVDKKRTFMATINSSASPWKNNWKPNYTFYTVDKIKKRSGKWINQGSKDAHFGYVYNVIGKMKVKSSYCSDLIGEKSTGDCKVEESVLFSMEPSQPDQPSPLLTPNTELAALIVKSTSSNPQESVKVMEELFSECSPENGISCSLGKECCPEVAVILPGGIHGLPKKGSPSSLIHRWGGSCDCGGWDTGCKLRILTNGKERCNIPVNPKELSKSGHVELFVQGGAQNDKAIFSFAPIEKRLYSIEFSPSISLLQAFFISVSITMCCHTSTNLPRLFIPTKEKDLLNDRIVTGCKV